MTDFEGAETTTDETFQRLLFRRQFLIGPERYLPNRHWRSVELPRGFHLSAHRDLPFTTVSRHYVTATLIGHAIDPRYPQRFEPEILDSLIGGSSDFNSFIDATVSLAGRWIIIYQDAGGCCLFSDPCAFRQVFYHSDGMHVWCASQPELIGTKVDLSLSADSALWNFLVNPELARNESAWVGMRTIYKDCFHLLPNHYLNVCQCKQVRFYPTRNIPRKEISEIIETAASILQGIMAAIAGRHNAILALTAGWDSRILLAASRDVSSKMEYYIDRMGVLPPDHPDVCIPERLAGKLNIKFAVRDSRDDLPGWFVSMLSRNVTGARVLPKTRTIYNKYVTGEKRMNINGNGGEICRNFFDTSLKTETKDIPAEDLARLLNYKSLPSFVLREIQEWEKSFNRELLDSFNILDLLYWEQRLGNWGAQYPAEQDIAVEEFSPFDCRLLIETLLASPRHMRAAPDYQLFKMLIRKMWPETLSVPVNPKSRRGLISAFKRMVRYFVPRYR